MKIKVINGPNLNMLSYRNIYHYGKSTYDELVQLINNYCQKLQIDVNIIQSNHEGVIIDEIHKTILEQYDGLIINPGAYTHYSYAIRDALEMLTCPIVEVHLSNIYNREAFRSINVIKDVVSHSIINKGVDGYIEAIKYLLE